MKAPITMFDKEQLEMYKDCATNYSVWFNGEKQFIFGAGFTEKKMIRNPVSKTVQGRMQNFFNRKVTTVKKDETIDYSDTLLIIDEERDMVVQQWRFV